ncbi:hypothetical protein BgiBS90_021285 [Biomphalaria glabrata]|nr:hypothetical protein BgiBS90_021285 [Biomphalaria glabrata]
MQVHSLEPTVVVHWEPCLTSNHVQVHSLEHTVVAYWEPCLTSPPHAGTLTRAYSGSSLGAMSHISTTCRYTG